MGALLVIDRAVGTSLAADLMAPGGDWERWVAAGGDTSLDPEEKYREVRAWCDFASTMRGCSGVEGEY